MQSTKEAPHERSERRRSREIERVLMRLSEMVPLGHGFGTAANLTVDDDANALPRSSAQSVHRRVQAVRTADECG